MTLRVRFADDISVTCRYLLRKELVRAVDQLTAGTDVNILVDEDISSKCAFISVYRGQRLSSVAEDSVIRSLIIGIPEIMSTDSLKCVRSIEVME